MIRSVLPSTLRVMPVIQLSISLDSSPSPRLFTWSVQSCTPSGVHSARLRPWYSSSQGLESAGAAGHALWRQSS